MMLYSESVERHTRFKTALKISFPFLIFLALYIFIFNIFDLKHNDFFLLIFFVIIYIYYIFYLIYQSFKISLLDNNTKTFNSEVITKEIKKALDANKNGFVAMVSIKNITFVEEQYGVDTRDEILKKFIQKLNSFLISKNFKNISIGKYQSGSFLLLFKDEQNRKLIKHLLNEFCKKISNEEIDNIEINTQSSIVNISYDTNVKNIISKLINLPNEEAQQLNILIKPDEFDILIKKAIKKEKFINQYQYIYAFGYQDRIKYLSVSTKIYIENFGHLTKNQISKTIQKNSYEIEFDFLAIKTILKEIKEILIEKEELKVIIKVSIASFKNNNFLVQLLKILKNNDINPNKICLLLNESKIYENTNRLKEIVKKYKDYGFCIIFDEFGLNNAAMAYLKENVGFDMFAIDLEFTKNLNKNSYFEILKAMINMCKALNIKTLIKFVDKREIEDKLNELKPDYVQGFLYDKPKLISKIIKEKDEVW
jgi:EAL domain-containing protein (putative c-di-GMP-specific phosphodiesterase class I)/GGDEF domain-containing protein